MPAATHPVLHQLLARDEEACVDQHETRAGTRQHACQLLRAGGEAIQLEEAVEGQVCTAEEGIVTASKQGQ